MKFSLVLFIFCLFTLSLASYPPQPHIHHDNEAFHLPNFTKIINAVKPTLQYNLNFSIDPSNSSNFMGVKYTTQQFSSIFPPMKQIQPAQNISFNIFVPLNPFKLINMTGYKVNVDFNAHVDIIVKDGSNKVWTSANLTGWATLEVVNIIRGIHLYIADFQITNVLLPDSEKAKVSVPNLLDTINGIGYLGIDKVNNKLGEKSLPGSSLFQKLGSVFQDNFMMIARSSEPEIFYQDDLMTVTIEDVSA